MTTSKTQGRMIGGLLVLQLTGFIVPFVLLHPIATSSYLVDAAPAAGSIELAVLLLCLNGILTVATSLIAWRSLRPQSSTAGLMLLSAGVVMLLLQLIDNTHVLSMLSLSQTLAANPHPSESTGMLAAIVATTRKWTHYSELVSIDIWIAVFYSVLYRFAFVPRWISGFGLLTVVIHFGALVLPMILGGQGITPLGAIMSVSHLLTAGWLLVKGIAEGAPEGRVPVSATSASTA